VEDIPRAFIGCRVPEPIAIALAERIGTVRRDADALGLRRVHHARFHVTLRFLGRVAGAERAAIVTVVAPIARSCAPIECRFGAVIALPSWRRAQVVAVEVRSNGALESLARRVEDGLRVTFGVADKPFRAHVTVVRVERARPSALRDARERFAALSADVGAFVFDAFSLFRSDSTPDGPRYTAVEHFPFAAA